MSCGHPVISAAVNNHCVYLIWNMFFRLGPLKYVKVNDVYKYNFEFDANADNSYVIVPISDVMLFSPSFLRILGENECHDNIASFNGELGKVRLQTFILI